MNKMSLIEALSNKLKINKLDASKMLNAMLEIMSNELKNKNEIKLTNFGRFYIKLRQARSAINPQTGAKIRLPSMNIIKFKPAKNLIKK